MIFYLSNYILEFLNKLNTIEENYIESYGKLTKVKVINH